MLPPRATSQALADQRRGAGGWVTSASAGSGEVATWGASVPAGAISGMDEIAATAGRKTGESPDPGRPGSKRSGDIAPTKRGCPDGWGSANSGAAGIALSPAGVSEASATGASSAPGHSSVARAPVQPTSTSSRNLIGLPAPFMRRLRRRQPGNGARSCPSAARRRATWRGSERSRGGRRAAPPDWR